MVTFARGFPFYCLTNSANPLHAHPLPPFNFSKTYDNLPP